MSKTSMTVAALVAVVLGATGCGGSKSSTQATTSANTATTTAQTQPATGSALSAAQLIAKADPICARITAERLSHKIRSQQEYLRVSAELHSSEQQALAEMRKLTPPASLAATWGKMLAGYATISEDVAKVGQAVASRKTAELGSLTSGATRLQHQVATLALAAGFKECSQFI